MSKRSDKSIDLEEQLVDELKQGLFKTRHSDLAESLQRALDETTPERPGDPRDKLNTHQEPESEWI